MKIVESFKKHFDAPEVVSVINDSVEVKFPLVGKSLVFDFYANDRFLNSQKTISSFVQCRVDCRVKITGTTYSTAEGNMIIPTTDIKTFARRNGLTRDQIVRAKNYAVSAYLRQFNQNAA